MAAAAGMCAVCGGELVTVRGRMVPDPPRVVCPTCLADRMDLIREYADREYGRAYAAPVREVGSVLAAERRIGELLTPPLRPESALTPDEVG